MAPVEILALVMLMMLTMIVVVLEVLVLKTTFPVLRGRRPN